ncbi:MAG: hypothetical protein BWX85_00835 [Chloroflexi bacterium ADurb.Bin120]|nr:MAG: hypothetical protein BWX85_00835 [Chloroflexi bacterium ADurb.Bin120]
MAGMAITDVHARRGCNRMMATKLIANISMMRPMPIAWSAKNRLMASISEVAREIRSPVLASAW